MAGHIKETARHNDAIRYRAITMAENAGAEWTLPVCNRRAKLQIDAESRSSPENASPLHQRPRHRKVRTIVVETIGRDFQRRTAPNCIPKTNDRRTKTTDAP